MISAYNKDEDDQYLMYYDVDNLYGWAMMQPLPYAKFSWVENIHDTFWDVPEDPVIEYYLEVDLEYPYELHKHKYFSFCAERRCALGEKHKKFMTTLHNKERYAIHYWALQQVLKHGLKSYIVLPRLDGQQKTGLILDGSNYPWRWIFFLIQHQSYLQEARLIDWLIEKNPCLKLSALQLNALYCYK